MVDEVDIRRRGKNFRFSCNRSFFFSLNVIVREIISRIKLIKYIFVYNNSNI